MPVPQVAEWFMAVVLAVTGLSHVICPRLWSELFTDLFRKRYAGLWIGMLTLAVGAPVAAAHNLWAWDGRVVATVVGWAWTVKGALYLLAPGVPTKIAARHIEHPSHFAFGGAVLLALSGVLVFGMFRAGV